jgi:nitrite reductase (cytochrome c-552)
MNAENSMGFHAPAESLRILGESIDYARQGVLEAVKVGGKAPPSEARKVMAGEVKATKK